MVIDRVSGCFEGFSPEALAFLREVRERNSRQWFEERRRVYQELLLEPFRALVMDLTHTMLGIDSMFEVRPAVNKTLSRIHRDTRFSRDKSLYRDSMWLTFRRPRKNWRDAPAYFYELSPSSYRYGMGYYSATRSTMDRFREQMDADPAAFRQIASLLEGQTEFVLAGEKYKRLLPTAHPEDIQEWYQRKSLYLVCNRQVGERLYSANLVRDLVSGFELLAPLYQYLLALRAAEGA